MGGLKHRRLAAWIGLTWLSLAPAVCRAAEPRASPDVPSTPAPSTTLEAGTRRERAPLLSLRTRETLERASSPLWITVSIAGVSALLTAGNALALKHDIAFAPTLVGFGVTSVATTISAFGSEDSRRPVLASVAFLPAAGFALSAALNDDYDGAPRLSTGALAAGLYGVSALSTVNALAGHRAPLMTLRRHAYRLATPVGRARIAESELAGMEADLASHEPLLPLWVVMMPLGIAGAVALAPAFDDDRSDEERAWSAALGSIGLLNLLASTADVHPAAAYQDDLRRLQIRVVPAANGVALVGQF